MKKCKIIVMLLVLCLFATQLSCGVNGATTVARPAPGADLGTELVSWEDVWSYRRSNSGKDLVITEQTDSKGLFGRFLRAQTATLGPLYKDRQFQFWDDNALYGLSGNAKPGDTVLLHIICRSSTSGTTAEMHPALYLANELTTDSVKSTLFPQVTVPDTWTEYYFPSTVGTSEPNRLILFLGQKLQSLDIACMELYNCGDTPKEQLPNGSTDLTTDRSAGRLVIDYYSLLQRYSTNTSNVKVTEVTKAEGLFRHYLTVNTATVDGNYKNRQFRYYDEENAKDFTGNLRGGETALLHIICRSSKAGKTASFQPAIWKSGDSSTGNTSFVFDKYAVNDHWTEYWLPVKGGGSDPNRFAMFVGDQVQSLDIAMLELYACGNTEVTALPNRITDLEQDENVGTVVDLFEGFSGQEQATGYAQFPTAKRLSASQSYALTSGQTALLTGGNKTLVLSFIVKAPAACTQVTFTLKGNKTISQTYPVPVQWTRIDLPVKLSRLDEVSLEFEGEILLAGVSYEYRGTETIKSLSLRSGMHLLEDFVDVSISDTGASVVGVTMDLVKSGDRIYSIGNGTLTITDVSDVSAPKVLGRLGNMGSSIRQITLLGDGKHVFISSRQNGCYIVNVEDPAKPTLISRYDSVEMATGVDAYGDYVYVCDRQYGVEIVDVSDVYNPVQCAIVRGGTAQSCKVVDGILYMGSWNERSVDIYDVRQPSSPVYLGSAPLSGKGDGMMVATVSGRTYLYAATGQHGLGVSTETISDSLSEEDILSDLDFGQGNGLDIFDVTDPKNPVWLSTSRIDGRYYFPNNDYWEVELAEHEGRLYAYVLNTYNGVYILDVTDPAAPVRVARSYVASNLIGIQTYNGRATIFPYDQTQQRQSPIAAIAVEDGVLYMASSMTDLHICNASALQPYLYEAEEKSQAVAIETPTGDFYALDGSATGLSGFAQYQSIGQTYAAVVYNDLIYAACGKEGIVVLDENLRKLATIQTQDIAMDVQIYEGKLFCAESAGGLACYALSADGLSAIEQWRYVSSKGVVRQVRLSPKARWAIIQSGSVYGEILSTDAPTAPVLSVTANSQMYHHTLLHTLAGGRYTAVWAEGGNVFWFDFGVNDDYDVPVQINKWNYNQCSVNNGSMTGGVPGYPNYVLATKNIAGTASGGYAIYDPTATNSPVFTAKDADTPFSGKPAIVGNLLITGERINGRICIVDISDLRNPNVLKTVSVTGNPDIPYICDDYVLIPMGYQGLVKFDLAPWNGNHAAIGDRQYTSVAAAISACEAGEYVRLLGDVTEDLYVSADLYLDLNGCTLTGNITVAEGAKLYVFDSATADYSAKNRGKIIGSITGNLVSHFNTPASYGHNYKYLALEEAENVWSFHRYYLTVASVVLQPMYAGATTLNYKTVFKTNDFLLQYVVGYGAKLTGDTAVYADGIAEGFLLQAGVRNELITALEGTMKTSNDAAINAANALAAPDVCAFIRLEGGSEITSASVQYSLKAAIVAANAAANLTDAQKAALGRMYLTFLPVFDAWTDIDLSNIKAYAPKSVK